MTNKKHNPLKTNENTFSLEYLNKNENIKISQSRRLPHWHQDAKMQFITFRLSDSLPQSKLIQLRQEKENWEKQHPEPLDKNAKEKYHELFSSRIDLWLDTGYGSCILRNKTVANIVSECLNHYDKIQYNLIAYVVMANHVHVLMQVLPGYESNHIIKGWKGVSAYKINKMMNKTGDVWQKEYFDRIIRDVKHLDRVVRYIEYNYSQGGVLALLPNYEK